MDPQGNSAQHSRIQRNQPHREAVPYKKVHHTTSYHNEYMSSHLITNFSVGTSEVQSQHWTRKGKENEKRQKETFHLNISVCKNKPCQVDNLEDEPKERSRLLGKGFMMFEGAVQDG